MKLQQHISSVLMAGVLMLTSLMAGAAMNEWNMDKDEDGIKVYTRMLNIENPPKGVSDELLAYKGSALMHTDIPTLLDTMRDVPHFDKWLHNSFDPSVAEKIDNDTRVVYQRLHMPWPLKDRDLLLKQTIVQAGDSYMLDMRTTESQNKPEDSDYVRMPYYKGYWRFEQAGEGQVLVTYEGVFDIGGSVPTFLSNMRLIEVPFYSLRNLRSYLDELKAR